MTIKSSSLKSATSAVVFAVALLLGTLLPHRLSAQNATLVYGSSSGAPQVVKATASALWVSLQGGVPPSLTAGSGTGTFKPGGLLVQMLTSITDASVQNQWNVGTVTIPANTLVTNGDTLTAHVAYTLAANANTKPYQLYFAPSTATCSGSGATLCNSGCQIQSNSSTSNAVSAIDLYTITRTSSGNQKYYGTLPITSSIQRTDLSTCTITDTADAQIAFGIRNNDAAAASVSASIINVWYDPK